MLRNLLFLLTGLIISNPLYADQVLTTEKLADNIYALIGPITNRDSVNLGNNANFGVIVTNEGVVLIDPGATHKGAQMIHTAIRKITSQPIKWVINSGGQDHRWMGNAYFKQLGATIIASEKAVADQQARLQSQLNRLSSLLSDKEMEGTSYVHADETFSDLKLLEIGNTRLEIYHTGQAHTPGDSYIWLPDHKIMFTGDIVYMDRMLRIGSMSAHKSWISVFKSMADKQPEVVVAGHGHPASLAKAKADTHDYLVFLRQAVMDFIDEGNGMEDIAKIDQSQFSYLTNYNSLKGRNALRVFEELEWE